MMMPQKIAESNHHRGYHPRYGADRSGFLGCAGCVCPGSGVVALGGGVGIYFIRECNSFYHVWIVHNNNCMAYYPGRGSAYALSPVCVREMETTSYYEVCPGSRH